MMTIFHLFVLLVCFVNNVRSDNDTQKALTILEKEKYDLALKIQEAIEDSAKTLQKNNDSDAIVGLKHLAELKKHFNESAIESEQLNASRRSDHPRYIQKGRVKLDLFDIASLFGKKERVNKLVREKNQALMREKLKEWIKEKEQERKKIKEYKEKMNLISERCPRNGLGTAKKKKKKTRRALEHEPLTPSKEKKKDEEREKRKEQRRLKRIEKKLASRRKYPCCRKCCKRSYLGCL